MDGKEPQRVRFDPSTYPKKPVTVKHVKGAVDFSLDLESGALKGKVLQAPDGKLWPDDTPYVMTALKSGDVVRFVSEPPGGFRVALDAVAEARAIEAFAQCDANKDGSIDLEELAAVFNRIDPELWTDDRLKQLMLAVDTNKDGAIQYDEFCHWVFGSNVELEQTSAEAALVVKDFKDALDELERRKKAEAVARADSEAEAEAAEAAKALAKERALKAQRAAAKKASKEAPVAMEEIPGASKADVEALKALIDIQAERLPAIQQELEENGRKIDHWAWWVFPTALEGKSDPQCTRVTRLTAPTLCSHGPTASAWKRVLEKICELVERNGTGVLPDKTMAGWRTLSSSGMGLTQPLRGWPLCANAWLNTTGSEALA
eukprot:CAMPEP_0179119274 /NCGR_PEP_ID=MMETSP0796-20121207/56140_1 /TAXON_ID=73915 /ORGANISM="Pyrodinium bahamense, Strain pbaha01" /LENGTH=374 /DNA_ID=CAMNT_0020817769 /DNA_START=20 /DNA_END=1141 /DNA_ORIENTATION=+